MGILLICTAIFIPFSIGVFRYIISSIESRGKFASDIVYIIFMKILFFIILAVQVVLSLYLTPILLANRGLILTFVQFGNAVMVIMLSIKMIVRKCDHYDEGEAAIYFALHVLIGTALSVLTALMARSFMYLYGEIWAIVNYCIIVGAAIISYVIVWILARDDYSFRGWKEGDEWLATCMMACIYALAVIASYFIMFMVFMIKESYF